MQYFYCIKINTKMKGKFTLVPALAFSVFMASCNSNDGTATTTTASDTTSSTTTPQLKEENVTYTADSVTANGYIVYDATKEGKRPAVLVVHEWWGQTDYVRNRAKQLAEMGYIAMAVDMY